MITFYEPARGKFGGGGNIRIIIIACQLLSISGADGRHRHGRHRGGHGGFRVGGRIGGGGHGGFRVDGAPLFGGGLGGVGNIHINGGLGGGGNIQIGGSFGGHIPAHSKYNITNFFS